MAYTTIDDPTTNFTAFLRNSIYGGSDTSYDIGFQPDWIWDKVRSTSGVHAIFDSVRGVGSSGKILYMEKDDAEGTNALIKSIDSSGFTVTASSDHSSQTIVDWCWKAGTSFSNDASATGIGTIDSSGSVNDTAGFSIVIRTGTASAGTIKHGLSTTPKMIITKMRSNAESWGVYNVHIGNTKYLKLDVTDAPDTSSVVWNNTTPTNSVFSVGSSALTNGSSKTYVDYIFSDVKGYSKFGKYTGNGNADGPFAYTGFRPAWIMIKNVSQSQNWYIYDNKRSPSNVADDHIYADLPNAEVADASFVIDILSNGFKMRNSNDGWNGSGEDYMYMAFAESPMINSKKVPNNAR